MTTVFSIVPSKAPNLPVAPQEYDADFQNKFENLLRLYFNQIDSAIGQIVGSGTSSNPNFVVTNNESPYALPPYLQVSRGLVSGTSVVNIIGYQTSVGSATSIPIWENAIAYTYPPSAIPMTLYSSSASDTSVSVQINGLDTAYNISSEILVCTGTLGAVTTGSYLRINSISITGSNNAVGTIYLSNAAKTVTYAQIAIGIGRSQMAIYTVPNGYSLYISRINMQSQLGGSTTSYVTYKAQTYASNGISTVISQNPFTANYTVTRQSPVQIPAKTDIQIQCQTNTGTTAIGVDFEGILIANGTS
jgi:hypothetical protein